jgi:RecB family endonuclease NucS
MHVESMSINSPDRKYHPSVKPGSGHDLFFKIARGKFRLWDKDSDPAPSYLGIGPQTSIRISVAAEEKEKEIEEDTSSDEFAYETDLRDFLAKNLVKIEPGLRLFKEEELNGIEYPVGGRYIDILAVDANDEYVVIELKVSRGYDRTAGQLLRYMAWVKKHLAAGKKVRGLIVAREISEDLRLAASIVSDVRLIEYELSFKLHPIEQ